MKYLVYIKCNSKVYPQLWSIDFTKTIEVRLGEIVKKYQLTDEDDKLNFDEIIRKYPYEKEVFDYSIGSFVTIVC